MSKNRHESEGQTHYSIGLDFGTNSVRALIVETETGRELAGSVWNYAHGESGIVLDPRDPQLARQHPQDYLDGIRKTVKDAIKKASKHDKQFDPDRVIGLGVDTTGSTPMPLGHDGEPLANSEAFADNPHAMAWLWKDHTGFAEAEEITAKAAQMRPQYLAKCGGKYSSEWFWSKILRCARVAPEVFDAAATWVEIADWIPAVLAGVPMAEIKRGICAAGHKAMFHPSWGGYPDEEFLGALDPRLARVRRALPERAYSVAEAAGRLSAAWAKKLGLPAGIPIAVGAFDAHLGGVGSGIQPGVLVKIIGTSTCDMMVAPLSQDLPDIPGLCGIVPESILPGAHGLEAGQSAVGDIFNWFVNVVRPGGKKEGSHEALTEGAEALQPGESGLLALDWNNGNRTILVDQRLTGLMLGMTLHTTPAEMYRALLEATAFGARMIMERFEEYGVKVERVVNCGGISVKNPLVMQIYADVMGRTIEISQSTQTCALGSAVAGAMVAGKAAGGYDGYADAVAAMTRVRPEKFTPNPAAVAVYNRIFPLYKKVHDSFGCRDHAEPLFDVMKTLLEIRDEVRGRD